MLGLFISILVVLLLLAVMFGILFLAARGAALEWKLRCEAAEAKVARQAGVVRRILNENDRYMRALADAAAFRTLAKKVVVDLEERVEQYVKDGAPKSLVQNMVDVMNGHEQDCLGGDLCMCPGGPLAGMTREAIAKPVPVESQVTTLPTGERVLVIKTDGLDEETIRKVKEQFAASLKFAGPKQPILSLDDATKAELKEALAAVEAAGVPAGVVEEARSALDIDQEVPTC